MFVYIHVHRHTYCRRESRWISRQEHTDAGIQTGKPSRHLLTQIQTEIYVHYTDREIYMFTDTGMPHQHAHASVGSSRRWKAPPICSRLKCRHWWWSRHSAAERQKRTERSGSRGSTGACLRPCSRRTPLSTAGENRNEFRRHFVYWFGKLGPVHTKGEYWFGKLGIVRTWGELLRG